MLHWSTVKHWLKWHAESITYLINNLFQCLILPTAKFVAMLLNNGLLRLLTSLLSLFELVNLLYLIKHRALNKCQLGLHVLNKLHIIYYKYPFRKISFEKFHLYFKRHFKEKFQLYFKRHFKDIPHDISEGHTKNFENSQKKLKN